MPADSQVATWGWPEPTNNVTATPQTHRRQKTQTTSKPVPLSMSDVHGEIGFFFLLFVFWPSECPVSTGASGSAGNPVENNLLSVSVQDGEPHAACALSAQGNRVNQAPPLRNGLWAQAAQRSLEHPTPYSKPFVNRYGFRRRQLRLPVLRQTRHTSTVLPEASSPVPRCRCGGRVCRHCRNVA